MRALAVDGEVASLNRLRLLLRGRGYEVETASSGEEGMEAVRRTFYHLALLGIGGGGEDLETLRRMKAHDFRLPVIVLADPPTLETARGAIQSGAANYLPKSVADSVLLAGIQQCARPSPPLETVLIACGDPVSLRATLEALTAASIPALGFARADEALRSIAQGTGEVLLADLHLPDLDGLRLIADARKARPGLVSILLAERPSFEVIVQAARLGVLDHLPGSAEPARLIGAVRTALEKARRESLPGYLRPGRAYRFEERGAVAGLLDALLSRGLPGLWVSRNPPVDVRPSAGLRLCNLGNGCNPGSVALRGANDLMNAVEEFCRQGRSAVLLEDVEYLSVHEGFRVTFRMLTVLRDAMAATGSILLVVYSPRAFTEQERELLARELEVPDPAGRAWIWEAAASKLSGGERVLYDLLRRTGGQGHQGDLVASAGFSKARVSRVLARMERQGLIARRRDGMGNLVALV